MKQGSERSPKPQKITDGLSFRNTLASQFLPFMVTAMTLLAAFALSGAFGAHQLAKRWSKGVASVVIIQIPPANPTKDLLVTRNSTVSKPLSAGKTTEQDSVAAPTPAQQVLHILKKHKEDFRSLHLLTDSELHQLVAPWLGHNHEPQNPSSVIPSQAEENSVKNSSEQAAFSIPLPDIIEVHLVPGHNFPTAVADQINQEITGSHIEYSNQWSDRLHLLAISLQICAAAALLLVLAISCAVIAITTRTGLIARRRAIHLVHSLGATDGYIAARFSFRIALLTLIGGIIGTAMVFPFILFLGQIITPFTSVTPPETFLSLSTAEGWLNPLRSLALPLILSLALLPLAAAFIGWFTTQITVRTWLRRLP